MEPRELEVVDMLIWGWNCTEIGARLGLHRATVQKIIERVGRKIAGWPAHPPLIRVQLWRASQIAVREYLCGLRDEWGLLVLPRIFPPEHPDHPDHRDLFPTE